MRACVVAVLAGALLLAGCASTPPTPIPSPSQPIAQAADLSRFYDQTVKWTNCGDAECTKVLVPMDYASPDGATVELAVSRVPATGERIGSLFVNPGGPGGSAFDYAKSAQGIVSSDVLDGFDIVGVDPRGVGKSDPIECMTDAQRDALLEVDGTTDSAADEQAVVDAIAQVAALCGKNGGELVHHVGTVNVARDLDIVRSVVGDERFNYLGLSYGTNLGAVYAELFPQRVGRMVLDGALPASLDFVDITKEQAQSLEYAFHDFARDCAEQSDCPFTGGPKKVAAKLLAFLRALDDKPIMVGKRVLNEAVASYAVLSYLYFPEYDYPALREALNALVKDREGGPLLTLLDERQSRGPDGAYLDNSTDAFYAVTCADSGETVSRDTARQYAKEWGAQMPAFGESLAWGVLTCNNWPKPGEAPITRTTAAGSAPILVVSTKHDPATPYQWGVRLADELASGHLLTWTGTNHTAYLSGSSCIDEHIDSYLLHGTVPSEGTVCD